jgi:hypothetical protein
MIFSEVQRTLVKSPPELWAELSDPEALARHLGEFGEIRITRVQPEQKVEWEAAAGEVSGTVAIKPSGWGTKVKLTVARELGPPEHESHPAHEDERAEVEIAAGAVDEGPEATQSVEREEDEPAAPNEKTEVEPTIATAEERAPGMEANLEGSPDDDAEAGLEVEPLPEPWHDSGTRSEDSDGDSRHLLEADVDIDEPAQPTSASEPRRGFFARLFRRRRAPQSTIQEAPAVELEDQGEDDFEQDNESLAAGESFAAGEADRFEPRAIAGELEYEAAGELELATEHEDDDARLDDDAGLDDSAERSDDTQVELEQAANEPAPSAEETAELEAAEELATEQATAVLTGVLDRLGAAHHRPFSRA